MTLEQLFREGVDHHIADWRLHVSIDDERGVTLFVYPDRAAGRTVDAAIAGNQLQILIIVNPSAGGCRSGV